jgi:hypothetical protein
VIGATIVSRTAGKVGLLLSSATSPTEVYVVDLERG